MTVITAVAVRYGFILEAAVAPMAIAVAREE